MKSCMKTVLLVGLSAFLATGCGVTLFPPSKEKLAQIGFDGFDSGCRSLLPEDTEGYLDCREKGCKDYPDAPQCDGAPGTDPL